MARRITLKLALKEVGKIRLREPNNKKLEANDVVYFYDNNS